MRIWVVCVLPRVRCFQTRDYLPYVVLKLDIIYFTIPSATRGENVPLFVRVTRQRQGLRSWYPWCYGRYLLEELFF